MKTKLATARGRITDWKTLTTEKGKTLAHLQIQDTESRLSWILVPASSFKKWESRLEEAFRLGTDIEVDGKREDLGTQVRLLAEQISFT